jgi:hypothetical protein
MNHLTLCVDGMWYITYPLELALTIVTLGPYSCKDSVYGSRNRSDCRCASSAAGSADDLYLSGFDDKLCSR